MDCLLSNFGARLLQLWTPDCHGTLADVVLGHDSIEDYIRHPHTFFGATVGRVANRTSGASFDMGKEKYHLTANDGVNHLHGGPNGFHNKIWDVEAITKERIVFTLLSPDGQEGYPGNVAAKVTYFLRDDNALEITYEASTDKDTPINITNHSYFNLKGNGSIDDHWVQINASHFHPIGLNFIPTGDLENVFEGPFDFRIAVRLGDRLRIQHPQLELGRGFDHNFVPDGKGLRDMAKVWEPRSGRTLEVISDELGVQFYSGNFLDGSIIGKNAIKYETRSGFCFETQHFPNSLNTRSFPTIILKAGDLYKSTCIYKFGVSTDIEISNLEKIQP